MMELLKSFGYSIDAEHIRHICNPRTHRADDKVVAWLKLNFPYQTQIHL